MMANLVVGLCVLCLAWGVAADWRLERSVGVPQAVSVVGGKHMSFSGVLQATTCSTANSLTLNASPVTVSLANTISRGPTACLTSTTKGQWFTISPSTAGHYGVTTCTSGTTEDTYLEVYNGCSATTCVGYQAYYYNSGAGCTQTVGVTVTFYADGISTYKILARSQNSSPTGAMQISIQGAAATCTSSSQYPSAVWGTLSSQRTCSSCSSCPFGQTMLTCTGSGASGRTCTTTSTTYTSYYTSWTTYSSYVAPVYGTYDPSNYSAPAAAVAAPVVTVVVMLLISVGVFFLLECRYRKLKAGGNSSGPAPKVAESAVGAVNAAV